MRVGREIGNGRVGASGYISGVGELKPALDVTHFGLPVSTRHDGVYIIKLAL